jgi:hypothetical protein
MQEQRQTERQLNLDDCMTIAKYRHTQTDDLPERSDLLPSSSTIVSVVEAPISDRKAAISYEILDLAELRSGESWLEIKHFPDDRDRRKPYYSTNIINRSIEKIRIDRFSTYFCQDNILRLHSISGGCFSTQQFQEWYDLGRSDWLEPGQSVSDSNNHSNLGLYWVYFGTTASGQTFVAGAPWLGATRSWWKFW